MRVQIPFGEGALVAELPDRTATIRPEAGARLAAVPDLAAEVRRALEQPLDGPRVRDRVGAGALVLIAFDDPTVMCFAPLRQMVIRQLLADLEEAGVRRDDISFMCANSLHRKSRVDELRVILGDELVDEFGPQISCHDAEDAEQLVYLGQTPGGYDVELNRQVVENDLTIYVNAAHNRGFSGGWKSVCVGLSTYRSIRHHHSPDGMSMSLAHNPMHAMLDEMGALTETKVRQPVFKVDTLLASPFEVARVIAGSVGATRRAAIEMLSTTMPARRNLAGEKFDVVIYGVPDWSPYAIFAAMNPLLTLVSSGLGYLGGTAQAIGRPGCSVILATPCPNQWDRVHHPSYPLVWEEVLSETRDPYKIQADYAERYLADPELVQKYRDEFAFHPVHAILATYPLKRLQHFGQVYVAGAVDPQVVGHLGFVPTPTLEEAVEMAQADHGDDCRIAYVAPPAAFSTH
ncbi:MAG: DUF2088 domain-containing protein [Planctomycetaceae bacterium]|nr:DUF2088 domain-containing protein [Planctomycetaceae bacterium]